MEDDDVLAAAHEPEEDAREWGTTDAGDADFEAGIEGGKERGARLLDKVGELIAEQRRDGLEEEGLVPLHDARRLIEVRGV